MAEEAAPRFRVIHSGEILALLRGWGEIARQRGIVQDYTAALREIHENLSTDPTRWGDPVYRLRHLDLLVYRRLYAFFLVEYGVHEAKRLVFIRKYALLPNTPLGT
jgi:hypothetical protein